MKGGRYSKESIQTSKRFRKGRGKKNPQKNIQNQSETFLQFRTQRGTIPKTTEEARTSLTGGAHGL